VSLYERDADETAIDFISQLLAKRPEDRMTMHEALHHEWLTGPTRPMSQPIGLGGDSVWEIESFEGDSDEDEERLWERPATLSGTNLASGVVDVLASRGDLGSDDSFSQPLENLRLATPAASRTTRLTIDVPSPHVNHAEASPASPPLTDEDQDVEAAVPVPSTLAVPSPLTSSVSQVDVSLKRKLVRGASGRPAFSSGSLSPPPGSSDLEPQYSSPRSDKRGRPARNTIRPSAETAIRQSPRKSTRIRK
jgi:serine/threonine/tyrosine protein kinase RAD53